MTKFLFPGLASFVLILIMVQVGCTRSGSEKKEAEEYFRLDSTEIGITTIISGLSVPWEIAWGPDNWIWFTEQDGKISRLNPETKETKLLLQVPDVFRKTMGLMSMVLHPDMKNSPYVYLNYTFLKKENATADKADSIMSRVVRYTYNGDKLTDPFVLLEIPGNTGHNGSRMVIAPDKTLMFATGDVDPNAEPMYAGNAQNIKTTGGKILRINLDGTIPANNPFPGNPIWALGFRVPQGLVFSSNGKLYSAEHGDATDDEVNVIEKGRNYGYPNVTGFCDHPEETSYCATHSIVEPLKAWTPTIAPAGIDYYNSKAIPEWQNSILLVTLKTQSFRVLNLNSSGNAIESEKVYFEKHFGRLRDICVSPSGDIYISTSNRDWNPPDGFPLMKDDRIIRISRMETSGKAIPITKASKADTTQSISTTGGFMYASYCASCHKEDGSGVKGVFPPLKGTPEIAGDEDSLLHIVLNGLSGPKRVDQVKYDQQMPSFWFLSDNQIALIASYVRLKFGNNSTAITPAKVSKARKRKK